MLTAVNSDWSDDGDSVTLTHPNRDPITLRPDHDSDALIA